MSKTSKAKPPGIRDRIKELRRVPAIELRANPRNWRQHPERQRKAMATALQEIGYADALLARELPDGTLELIDGHLRAETTPDDSVPVLILDVDEAEAKALLATLDPLAALAESDQAELDSLLAEIESETATLLHAPEADDAAEVEEIHLRPPAEVAWVLLAIPIERFADASAPLSQLESLADLTVQVSRGKEGG